MAGFVRAGPRAIERKGHRVKIARNNTPLGAKLARQPPNVEQLGVAGNANEALRSSGRFSRRRDAAGDHFQRLKLVDRRGEHFHIQLTRSRGDPIDLEPNGTAARFVELNVEQIAAESMIGPGRGEADRERRLVGDCNGVHGQYRSRPFHRFVTPRQGEFSQAGRGAAKCHARAEPRMVETVGVGCDLPGRGHA